MKLANIWEFIQHNIFHLTPGDKKHPLFNPYCSATPNIEAKDAARIRRENLLNYLESFNQQPQFMIIGEAPGWRGCRFSGVPFTSEAMLAGNQLPFTGRATSLRKSPHREATATIFWRVMLPYYPNFLAWNCLPFHPHQPGKPFSNRRPTQAEINAYIPILEGLIDLLQPKRVIAVGRSAQAALNRLAIPATPVRHPSHGGARDFEAGIGEIFLGQ